MGILISKNDFTKKLLNIVTNLFLAENIIINLFQLINLDFQYLISLPQFFVNL